MILQQKLDIDPMNSHQSAKERTLAQCVDLIRFRHLSINTEKTYCGHSSLETTMIYVHGDGERVRSPLDSLPPMKQSNVITGDFGRRAA